MIVLFLLVLFVLPSLQAVSICSQDAQCLRTQLQWLNYEERFLYTKYLAAKQELEQGTIRLLPRGFSYGNQYLTVQALKYCNQGHWRKSVLDVYEQIIKAQGTREVVTAACIADFANKNNYQTNTIQQIVRENTESNPILRLLLDSEKGPQRSPEPYLVEWGMWFQEKRRWEEAIDVYARLRGFYGDKTTNYLSFLSPERRQAIKTVQYCSKTASLKTIEEKTSSRAYQAGIPCVDAKTGYEKINAYRRLAIGIRSPEVVQILLMSPDVKTAKKLLALFAQKIEELERYEQTMRDLVVGLFARPNSYSKQEKMVFFQAHAANLQNYLPQISLNSLLPYAQAGARGVALCGVGLVKSFLTVESLTLIGLGGLLFVVGGPISIGIAVVAFVGAGMSLTALSAYTLEQEWKNLDLSGRIEGVCNVAAQALLTIGGGFAGAKVVAAKARFRANPRALRDLAGESPTTVKELLKQLREEQPAEGRQVRQAPRIQGIALRAADIARTAIQFFEKPLKSVKLAEAYRTAGGGKEGVRAAMRVFEEGLKKYDAKNGKLNEKLSSTIRQFLQEVQEKYPGMVEKILSVWERHVAREVGSSSEWGAFTAGHVARATAFAYKAAKTAGRGDAIEIGINVALHDVGKIGVNPELIQAARTLTPAEISEVGLHAEAGPKILRALDVPEQFVKAAGEHHTPGSNPFYSFADVLSALLEHRPYRGGLEATEALTVTVKQTKPPTGIVEAFTLMLGEYGYSVAPAH